VVVANINTGLLTVLAAVVGVTAALFVSIDALQRWRRWRPRPRNEAQRPLELEPKVGLDSAFLLEPPEKASDRGGQHALDTAIAMHPDAPGKLAEVRGVLAASDVYALGGPAGEISVPGQGTESDLLHFTIDANGEDRVMLPVFTQPDILRQTLLRNPDWQSLSVLQINGGDLLSARDPDVTLIINPWSQLEFQIPPGPPSPGTSNSPR
jgi:hypothetical protein